MVCISQVVVESMNSDTEVFPDLCPTQSAMEVGMVN